MPGEQPTAIVYGRSGTMGEIESRLQTHGYEVFVTSSSMEVRMKPEETDTAVVVIDADYGDEGVISRLFTQLSTEFPKMTVLFLSGIQERLTDAQHEKQASKDKMKNALIVDKQAENSMSLVYGILNTLAVNQTAE